MDPDTLKNSIKTVKDKIDTIIADCRSLVDSNPQQFVTDHVKKLGGLIGCYSHFLTNLKVQTRSEAESKWTKILNEDGVSTALDDLLDKEEEFDRFLEEIDVAISEQQKTVGGHTFRVDDDCPNEARLVGTHDSDRWGNSHFSYYIFNSAM